jgi:hypothetical protein
MLEIDYHERKPEYLWNLTSSELELAKDTVLSSWAGKLTAFTATASDRITNLSLKLRERH